MSKGNEKMMSYDEMIKWLNTSETEEWVEILHDVNFSTRITILEAVGKYYADREEYTEAQNKLLKRRKIAEGKI